jgi:Right handed beta helix region
MKRLGAVLVFAVGALGLYVVPAQAGSDWHGRSDWHGKGDRHGRSHGHGRSVWVVDDDYPDRGWCRFGHADFASIQEAVNASSDGDLVLVCPGTYVETVRVEKKLTIKGAKAGQDARWRDQTKESVITAEDGGGDVDDPKGDPAGLVQLLHKDITWDGFLIANNHLGPGMSTSEAASDYRIRNTIFFDNGIGLDLASNGKREVEVLNNRFTANNEVEPGGGYGIYSSRGAAGVLISDNLFELHNGASILFADNAGDPGRQQRVRIQCNKSVDDNSFVTLYASIDVQVVANTVRNENPLSTYDASAIFIGARNRNILVKANHIKSANGNGIDVRDSGAPPPEENPPAAPENVDVRKNKVIRAKLHGIDIAATGTEQYEVRGNLALRNGNVGIHVGAPNPDQGPADVDLTRNTARDNGTEDNGFLDCQDQTEGTGTAGTANLWEDNVGENDQPDGICGPQPSNHNGHHHGKHKHHKKRHHKKHPRYDNWCECPRTGRD